MNDDDLPERVEKLEKRLDRLERFVRLNYGLSKAELAAIYESQEPRRPYAR